LDLWPMRVVLEGSFKGLAPLRSDAVLIIEHPTYFTVARIWFISENGPDRSPQSRPRDAMAFSSSSRNLPTFALGAPGAHLLLFFPPLVIRSIKTAVFWTITNGPCRLRLRVSICDHVEDLFIDLFIAEIFFEVPNLLR